MNERTTSLLLAVIHEFIEHGEPVSSERLYRRYDFGIKPAMIRSELLALTEGGLLEQPHHSAGRIPTDRGYELFASELLREDDEAKRDLDTFRLFARKSWLSLGEHLAHELGMLSAVAPEGHLACKTGLEYLVEGLDRDSPQELRTVIRDFEELDERIARSRPALEKSEGVRIFIGRKSPITRSGELSVIAGSYDVGGEPVLLFAIGPKRMDYERAARTFKSLTRTSAQSHGRAKK